MDFDFSTETIIPDNTNLLTIGGTGGFELPLGTTLERPVTGLSNGALRYNTDTNNIEGYVSNSWTPIATGTTTITLTGDVTGSGAGSIGTTLATVNSNVGTFASVTVNAKGLVTSATALSGDITTSGAVTTLATVNSNVGQFVVSTVNGKGLVTAATNLSATGDAAGTSSGASIALTLATVNVSPQTDQFRKITVSGKGLVTATSAVSPADITTALGFTPINSTGDTMTGSLVMSSGTVITLPDLPTVGTSATNKNYVDAAIAGLSWKQAARAATTTAGTLATSFSNGSSIDGITLDTGDRILIKNQSTQSENGIYIVTAGTPTRSTDADVGSELIGATVYVDQGSTQADTGWTQTTPAPIILGSTNIVWAQFSGAGSYTAGTGLTLTGNTFSLTSPVLATLGGTGQEVYAVGDILSANTTTTLSRITDVATGNALISGGVNTLPLWGKIGLTTHVTGVLPVANGGSGISTVPTNGQLLIGNGTGYTVASLTAGTGITVTPGAGALSIATINNGTVTSVGLSLPSFITVTGSPVTTSGTLTGTLASQTTNTIFAAPNGSAGAPAFRGLVFNDISSAIQLYRENPSTPTAPVASGTNAVAIGSGSSSTSTSAVAIGAGTAGNVANIFAYANGSFATAGDAQNIVVMCRNTTTNAATTQLFVDGTSQRLVMPNNSTWAFIIRVAGRRTDTTGGWAMYSFTGGSKRDATAGSTTLEGASRVTIAKSAGPLNCTISADTTNGSININVTGIAAQTFRWVATVEITQITN